jgi:prepilin-type N-terminal cleavage/methylation domain-containing protein
MTMKQKGFTLIELMIVLAILGIVIAVAAPVILGHTPGSNASYGVNGLVESRCVDGLKFIVDNRGHATQVMDTLGHGVPCSETNPGKQVIRPSDTTVRPGGGASPY